MAEITDEMVDRAAAVIFEPPGLQQFMPPHTRDGATTGHNRDIIRRALAAALQSDAEARHASCSCMTPDEDRIRAALAEAYEHPGRTITR